MSHRFPRAPFSAPSGFSSGSKTSRSKTAPAQSQKDACRSKKCPSLLLHHPGASLEKPKVSVPPVVKLAAAFRVRPALDPDILVAEIAEDLQAALAKLYINFCPQCSTSTIEALPACRSPGRSHSQKLRRI